MHLSRLFHASEADHCRGECIVTDRLISEYCLHLFVYRARFYCCTEHWQHGRCGYESDAYAGTLKVIDFGLSKRYIDEQDRVIPRREGRVGFRGSTAYASMFAHEELEQGNHHLLLCTWLQHATTALSIMIVTSSTTLIRF